MMKKFRIVVPSFNSVDYITKTLQSIEDQTYRNFDVCVIDDGSTIGLQKQIIEKFCTKNNWKAIYHSKNVGALQGMVEAIQGFDCDDDDVIVVIDGDDWLAHPQALERLHQVYTDEDVLLTYGQCEKYPPGNPPMHYAQPVADMIIEQKLYRDITFIFWHPGTFKYKLWKNIRDEDLRDEDGRYFRLLKDKATLFPMLEMAGKKIRHITEVLYIYNVENPLNDYATCGEEEYERVNTLLKSRKRYDTLE